MKTRNLVRMALFAALTAVCSQIIVPLPFTPIPFSFSIIAVFLTGAVLPKSQAFIAQLVYILIGAIGLPVFAAFGSGIGYIMGPTGGYLIAYPFMAIIVAYVSEIIGKKTAPSYAIGMVCALVVCYLLGTSWLAGVRGLSFEKAFLAGAAPFIITDLVKVGISASAAVVLNKALVKMGVN